MFLLIIHSLICRSNVLEYRGEKAKYVIAIMWACTCIFSWLLISRMKLFSVGIWKLCIGLAVYEQDFKNLLQHLQHPCHLPTDLARKISLWIIKTRDSYTVPNPFLAGPLEGVISLVSRGNENRYWNRSTGDSIAHLFFIRRAISGSSLPSKGSLSLG